MPQKRLADYITTTHFPTFIERSFQTINPGKTYLPNWHIGLIAEHLRACETGQIKRLIINMPPRHMKSICASVTWPAWLLAHNPSRRMIVASYSQPLSTRLSLDTRHVMQAEWYQRLFPQTQIATGQNEKHKFATTEHGFRFATSVGGSVTGEGGDFLILDDPHNPADILSDNKREATLNWFDQTFSSRLDNQKTGVFVLVMQRLHPQDMTQHLLSKAGVNWRLLEIPLYAEHQRLYQLNHFQHIFNAGEVLHPERMGQEEIERLKQDMGAAHFAAQYLQTPVPLEGRILKKSWLRYYPKEQYLPYRAIYHSWDTAIKTGAANDYTALTVWGEYNGELYLLDVLQQKLDYPALRKCFTEQTQQWNPEAILIEDKASGQSLLQDMRKNSYLPIIAVKAVKDKLTRFASATALFEGGRVRLPQEAPWLADYERQLLEFPGSRHDDMVDATSQFLNWFRLKQTGSMSVRSL